MSIRDATIADLTALVEKGKDEAMGELARRCVPAMLRYAKRLLGIPLRAQLDAEDVVQSTLITMWLGIRTGKFALPTPQSLSALARTLLRRQVARHWHKAKAEMNATQDSAMTDTVPDRPLMPIAPAEDGPREMAEFEDLMETFLSKLTETDRQLVTLRFRGFTTAKAAVFLHMEPGRLRIRLSRLRAKFADLRRELMTRG
jgi:RNA polymerase sigma factor (sigma-70 family)